LAVTPDTVPGGVPVLLTATANDGRYMGGEPHQNIAAAQYSIDSPSWITGTITYPMDPSDGNFNNYIEDVQSTVDTGGLSAGKHTIFVESQDANGNWGVISAVFVNITTPDYGVMLTPGSATLQDDPGNIVTYHLQATNIGINGDTYDIATQSSWDYSAPQTTGYLAPGEQFAFDVQVTIPVTATHGESDTAVVTISSQTMPDVSDTSNLTTIANFNAVNITPPSSAGDGNPGEQVVYTLQITNLGNSSDSFALVADSQWTVTLPGDSVGPLAPGASVEITATVDVPLDGVPGDSDTATITATSQKDASKSASATLVTSVKSIFTFKVDAPIDHLIGYGKGAKVDYTILITNTGNITDSYDVLAPISNWPVDVPDSVGPVEPGKSISVLITVHVPLDIDIGDSNTARLMFVSVGGSSGHQVYLYTDTFWYSVYIPLSEKQ